MTPKMPKIMIFLATFVNNFRTGKWAENGRFYNIC